MTVIKSVVVAELLIGGVVLVGGCSSHFSPGVPGSFTATITATNDPLDGYSSHDGSSDDEGGSEIRVGTTQSNRDDVVVGFVHFDLPAGLTASSIGIVKLRVFLASMNKDPFARFLSGGIRVDHLDYGPTLDLSGGNDFYLPLPDTGVLEADIGQLTANGTVGWKEIDVTSQVKADLIAARPRSQFGLRFRFDSSIADSDGDSSAFNDEYVLFEDAGNHQATGNRPQLVIIKAKGVQ